MTINFPRIYIQQSLQTNEHLYLSKDHIHYIKEVLRMKVHNILEVFNNTNYIFLAKIIHFSKKNIEIKIFKKILKNVESPLFTHLGQVISKNKKMDFTIQKSIEMGVNIITPLISEYCIFQKKTQNILKKIKHWNKIAIAACQQSNRNTIPEITEPQNIFSWCKNINQTDTKIIFTPKSILKINQLPKSVKIIRLIIGPEGGFSDNEIHKIIKYGFISIGLGPRILRTETASVAAMTALQIKFGDLC